MMNLTITDLQELGVTPEALAQRVQTLQTELDTLHTAYETNVAGLKAQLERYQGLHEQLSQLEQLHQLVVPEGSEQTVAG